MSLTVKNESQGGCCALSRWKLLPGKGAEEKRRNWNKRDGTGIKEPEPE